MCNIRIITPKNHWKVLGKLIYSMSRGQKFKIQHTNKNTRKLKSMRRIIIKIEVRAFTLML